MAESNLSQPVQEVLQRARQILLAKQQTQMDAEHLMLALLQEPGSVPVQIISRLGGDITAIMRGLDDALDRLPKSQGMAPASFTPRASHVMQMASEEAERLHDDLVLPEHLLLAIADEQTGTSARLFHQAGIDRGKVFLTMRMIPRTKPQVPQEPTPPAPMPPAPNEELDAPGQPLNGPQLINPPALPKPRGFNHGILTTGGRMLFLSGQTALDGDGHIVAPGDVVAQYRQVLNNLKAVVEEAGGKMQDIVKVNIFVRDRDDYVAHLKPLGDVHRSFFGAYYPATALLGVSNLFDEEALVEIEGIAVLEEEA